MTALHRPPRHLLQLLLILGLALTLGACGDSNKDFISGKSPNIDTDKASLSFSVVGINETSSQLLTIINTGTAPLTINSMSVEGTGSQYFSLQVADAAGSPMVYDGTSFDIAAGHDTEYAVRVDYTPTEVGGADAELVISSNDPDTQVLRIPLVALEVGPQPQVTPNPIVFGQVAPPDVPTESVVITNVGSAPMEVTGLSLSGSTDFSLVLGEVTFPLMVAPNVSFEVAVSYAPPTQGPDLGSLKLTYNFEAGVPSSTRDFDVQVSANGAEPCIRVTPGEAIDFGQAVIGMVSEIDVTVENCGSENLEISSIVLGAGTDTKFNLESLPSELTSGSNLILARGSARQFKVTYAPTDETPSSGNLVIQSNDPARPEFILDIFGTGTFNNCPIAAAKARIRDSGNPWETQLIAEPLDYIQFDSSDTSDPDGHRIMEYRWSVIDAPTGFAIGFVPNARAESPEIQLALVGDYTFELSVIDENGLESCEPSRVTIRAKSDKSLIIELTWRTPSDLNESDTGQGQGTDLDLHFLRPGGFWEDRFGDSDVYFANAQGNWGAPGSDDDDAFIDRDDTDGGGPETITVRTPARTDGTGGANGYMSPYLVGVYFYDDWDFDPPVLATVRIFFNGEDTASVVMPEVPMGQEAAKQFVAADPSGARSGDFWLVGEIMWDAAGGSFNPIDMLMQGYPN